MAQVEFDINHVARLARLSLTAEERRRFSRQFGKILEEIAKLAEVDSEDVEPVGHISGLANVARDDQPEECLPREKVLALAPKKHDCLFEVPSPLAKR